MVRRPWGGRGVGPGRAGRRRRGPGRRAGGAQGRKRCDAYPQGGATSPGPPPPTVESSRLSITEAIFRAEALLISVIRDETRGRFRGGSPPWPLNDPRLSRNDGRAFWGQTPSIASSTTKDASSRRFIFLTTNRRISHHFPSSRNATYDFLVRHCSRVHRPQPHGDVRSFFPGQRGRERSSPWRRRAQLR